MWGYSLELTQLDVLSKVLTWDCEGVGSSRVSIRSLTVILISIMAKVDSMLTMLLGCIDLVQSEKYCTLSPQKRNNGIHIDKHTHGQAFHYSEQATGVQLFERH